MANTKTQKPVTIAKSKSENIVDWFVNEAHWKLLSEHLEFGKTAIFKFKKNLKEIAEKESPFDALAEIFTIKQLNIVIALFNDAIEHPEKYEKPKKKSEIDLKAQADVIHKHTKDMNMDYLGYEDKPKSSDKEAEKTSDKQDDKEAENLTKSEVLAKHQAERERIQALPKDSKERKEREKAYRESEGERIKEFWKSQKQDK